MEAANGNLAKLKKLTEELTNSESLSVLQIDSVKNIFNSMDVPIAIADINFNIVEANNLFAEFLEYDESEIIGKNIIDLHPRETLFPTLLSAICLKTMIPAQKKLDVVYLTKTGKKIFTEIIVNVIFDSKQKPFASVAIVKK